MLFDSDIDKAVRAGTPLTETAPWKALEAHHAEIRDLHMGDLFAQRSRALFEVFDRA